MTPGRKATRLSGKGQGRTTDSPGATVRDRGSQERTVSLPRENLQATCRSGIRPRLPRSGDCAVRAWTFDPVGGFEAAVLWYNV
jgi:hypothetical protein